MYFENKKRRIELSESDLIVDVVELGKNCSGFVEGRNKIRKMEDLVDGLKFGFNSFIINVQK
jgi:hypothetical protein